MKEGYIKFNSHWTKTKQAVEAEVQPLIDYRQKLYDLGFIGTYPDGVGFGNISMRSSNNRKQFIISGSKTGSEKVLTNLHFALVEEVNLKNNSIQCSGPVVASSESMSHAAIYQSLPWVNAVIHGHDLDLWKKLLHRIPTTPIEAEYGTPEMAKAIKNLINSGIAAQTQFFVMEGHEEGLFAFGRTIMEAYGVLARLSATTL